MKNITSLLFLLILLNLSSTIEADDGSPECGLSDSGGSSNSTSTPVPQCLNLWVGTVEADYITPSMDELGLAHISWLDPYGMDTGITRIFSDEIMDLSELDNRVSYQGFEGEYKWYAVGSEIYWGPGAAEDRCGFYLRYSNDLDHKYVINLNQNGSLRFNEWQDGTWDDGLSTSVSNLNTGQNAMNSIVIFALRDYFHILVNGEHVASWSDDTDMDEARGVGLSASTFDESEASYCTFHHAWIWPLTDWEWDE